MREIIAENFKKIKEAIPFIEKKLPVKIEYYGKKFTIKGEEFNEYIANEILAAINFSFNIDDALLLLNPDFTLHFVNIRDCTKKKNLIEVRSRVIGAEGRAKKTIEELTGAAIAIHENRVGIISDSIHLEAVIQAVSSLIRGSKHANVFAYLEKQNRERNKFDSEDLGLKEKAKKIKL